MQSSKAGKNHNFFLYQLWSGVLGALVLPIPSSFFLPWEPGNQQKKRQESIKEPVPRERQNGKNFKKPYLNVQEPKVSEGLSS